MSPKAEGQIASSVVHFQAWLLWARPHLQPQGELLQRGAHGTRAVSLLVGPRELRSSVETGTSLPRLPILSPGLISRTEGDRAAPSPGDCTGPGQLSQQLHHQLGGVGASAPPSLSSLALEIRAQVPAGSTVWSQPHSSGHRRTGGLGRRQGSTWAPDNSQQPAL